MPADTILGDTMSVKSAVPPREVILFSKKTAGKSPPERKKPAGIQKKKESLPACKPQRKDSRKPASVQGKKPPPVKNSMENPRISFPKPQKNTAGDQPSGGK